MDIDVQDTGAVEAAPTPEPRSRRRLLGAGLVGLAGTLVPQLNSRAAATTPPDTDGATGDTEPAATTTTAPARRPTGDDESLLGFAQTLELAAVALYDQALGGGSVADQSSLLTTLRESHQAYAQVIGGFLGTSAGGIEAADVVEQFGEGFGGSLDDVLAAAYDLETTALATHTELVGQLQGTEGAALLASILVAEARHATVLADLAGADLDAQLTSDAAALEPTKGVTSVHRPDHRSDIDATEPRTDQTLATAPFGRRRFIAVGGATAAGAALLAACGGEKPEVARVGSAPTTTEQPAAVVNDAVLLRTASSMEHSIIATYDALVGDDLLAGPFGDLADRFRSDHEAAATVFEGLTSAAGGTPWTDENPRLRDVTLPPILRRITGADANDTFPAATRSDDPARDAANLVQALESLSAASYQALVPSLSMPGQRQAAIEIAAQASRRAAVLAIAITGAPDAYVSPESVKEATGAAPSTTAAPTTTQDIAGGATEDTEAEATPVTEIPTLYAIPAQYGQLGAIQLVLGAPNESGTRLTVNLETPSNNTYVYEFLS